MQSVGFLDINCCFCSDECKNRQAMETAKEAAGTESNETQQSGCGNGMCEPNVGETEANCSQDCTGED